MLWKRHLSLYANQEKKEIETKKDTSKRSSLAPLQSVGKPSSSNNTIETNQTKFMIRKKSKSNKIAKHLLFNTFFLYKGNNHPLVKRICEEVGLIEVFNKQVASVIWYQGKQHPRKDFLNKQVNPKFNNYLPNHSEITNKQKLYENISRYFPESINTFIPKSYIVDFRENLTTVENNLIEFLSDYFVKNGMTRASKKNSSFYITNYYGQICLMYSRVFKRISESRKEQDSRKMGKFQDNRGQNLWIVKPTFLNRGQGIEVISTLKQLEKLLTEDNQQISIKLYQSEQKQAPSSYIIQQYISRPLLFQGFKFDMRVWLLLRKNKRKQIEVYIYRRGYVRLATHKYSVEQPNTEKEETLLNKQSEEAKVDKSSESPNKKFKKSEKNQINSRYVHLTNNAVQKNCKDYGILYEGNQLSITKMVEHLNYPELTEESLFADFIRITKIMLESCKEKLFAKATPSNFMLIGMDFLLDRDFNVWLIEANCNPCLEESSPLLKQWLPSMLREMLIITRVQKLGKANLLRPNLLKTAQNSKMHTISVNNKQSKQGIQNLGKGLQQSLDEVVPQINEQEQSKEGSMIGHWQRII